MADRACMLADRRYQEHFGTPKLTHCIDELTCRSENLSGGNSRLRKGTVQLREKTAVWDIPAGGKAMS